MRFTAALSLIERLAIGGNGALSTQVLGEFYNTATRKLRRTSEDVELTIQALADWSIHRPGHLDIIRAIHLQRRYQLSWWDAMIVNSAIRSGCTTLWSEDLNAGQSYESVTVRNPFA